MDSAQIHLRTHPFKLARDVQANLNESNFLKSPLVCSPLCSNSFSAGRGFQPSVWQLQSWSNEDGDCIHLHCNCP